MPARDVRLIRWGLWAACLLVYANTLAAGYTYDDKAIVRDNPRIRAGDAVEEIFATSYFGSPRGTAYRPVLLLSFALQWWTHGRSAFAFHLVNVLLHAGATVLLFRLFLRLRIEVSAAAAGSLLFAVLPIHAEAVAGLVGRGETLTAVLVLASLHVALTGLERQTGPIVRGLRLAAFLLLYAAALLTKESAVVLPGLLFLALALRADGGPLPRGIAALRSGWPLYLGAAVMLAAVFGLRTLVLGGAVKSGGLGIFELENPLASVSWKARAANAALLMVRAIGRTVLPLNLSADESAWSLPVLSPFSPAALSASILCAALVVAAVWRAGARPPLSFAVLFLFLAALPTANVLFATGTIFAERLMYLPSAGLCLCGGLVFAGARRGFPAGASRAAAVLFAVAVVLMAARTAVRNTVWADDETLFSANARTSPGSAKSEYNLGWVRAESGRFADALPHYARAVELYPGYFDAWSGKGRVEMELSKLADAQASYGKAAELSPTSENAHFGAGLVRERLGDDAGAARAYRRGLVARPDSLPLAFRLATVRSRIPGEDAGPDWKRALMIAPNSAASRLGYARWLRASARPQEGAAQAREAVRRNPRLADGWRLLAELAAQRGADLAELLARERVFRLTRSGSDLAALMAAAEKSPAATARLARLRPALERLAPKAFREVEAMPKKPRAES